MKKIQDIIKEKILILDGAMGTMIQQYNLVEKDFRGHRFADSKCLLKGNNDILNITRPDVVEDIHEKYLQAGADIITTNTFSSQRISQADYSLQDVCEEMACEGAKIARKTADKYSTEDKPRFVAGSVGSTTKTCSIDGDIKYDALVAAYREQIDALIDGGVDALLFETIFDLQNSKAAMDAAVSSMKEKGISLSQLIGRIARYQNSGEINFRIEDKKGAMDAVREFFISRETPTAQMDFDGYRVEFPDWWFNIRPSNTEPYLRFICEATSTDLLEEKVSLTKNLLIERFGAKM